jgi:hypothetical protein
MSVQQKMHYIVEQLDEDEQEKVWNLVYALYCDFYTLKAIHQVKRSQQPWDTLTHEEAVRHLIFS